MTNIFCDFENREKVIENSDLRYDNLSVKPPFNKNDKKSYIAEFCEKCIKFNRDYNVIMRYRSNYFKRKKIF